jgi:hypothetical protein
MDVQELHEGLTRGKAPQSDTASPASSPPPPAVADNDTEPESEGQTQDQRQLPAQLSSSGCAHQLAFRKSVGFAETPSQASEQHSGSSDGGSERGDRPPRGSSRRTVSLLRVNTLERQTTQKFLDTHSSLNLQDVPADEIDIDALTDVTSSDWGLDMLVRVGEAWAPTLIQMDKCVISART